MGGQRVPHELDRLAASPGAERVRCVHDEDSGDVARVTVESDVEERSEQREHDEEPDHCGQPPLKRANAYPPAGEQELGRDRHEGRNEHPRPQRRGTAGRGLAGSQGPALGREARHRREGRLRSRGVHSHEQFGAVWSRDAPHAGTLDYELGRPRRKLDRRAGRVGYPRARLRRQGQRLTDLDRRRGQHRPRQLGQQAVAEKGEGQLQRQVRVAQLERQVGEPHAVGSPPKQQGR